MQKLAFLFLAASLTALGCSKEAPKPAAGGAGTGGQTAAQDETTSSKVDEADIQAALNELKPEDRSLAEAQRYCPVMADNRLGSMGPPFKVMVKDQPVFLCCKGCRRKALADPDMTLAKVEELKERAAKESKEP